MRRLALAVFGAALVAPNAYAQESTARKPPQMQWASGLLIGGGVQRIDDRDRRHAVFFLGARADAAFFRNSPRAVGFGPYVEVATTAFRSLEGGAGLNLTLPVGSPTLQLAAGPHVRTDAYGTSLGLTTTALFGSRSYNYSSAYGYSVGGFLQGRFGLSHLVGAEAAAHGQQRDLLIGVQIDFELLALPALFGISVAKHGLP